MFRILAFWGKTRILYILFLSILRSEKQIYLLQSIYNKQSAPEEIPMERRLGTAIILIEDRNSVTSLNHIISKHAAVIIGRQGIPLRDKGLNIISLVLDGTTAEIGALTGQIGRLSGVQVKSALLKATSNPNITISEPFSVWFPSCKQL